MKSLLILAGVSGSGKSTVLQDALSNRLALFGDAFDPAFQKTTIPPVFPESRLPLAERLALGTWLITRDVFAPEIQHASHDCLVLHFDLFSFIFRTTKWHPALKDVQAAEDFIKFLSSEDNIVAVYKLIFSTPLFRERKICIKTLQPAYQDTYTQWQRREIARQESGFAVKYGALLSQVLYGGDDNGRMIYERVYHAWQRAISHARAA